MAIGQLSPIQIGMIQLYVSERMIMQVLDDRRLVQVTFPASASQDFAAFLVQVTTILSLKRVTRTPDVITHFLATFEVW